MISTIYEDERALLTALSIIESNEDTNARGDISSPDGPALGCYQIHQHAWDEISKIRASIGQPIYPYHDALIELRARSYATTFLRTIISRFKVHHQAPPSLPLLYACYSLGPACLPKIPYMTDMVASYSPFEPIIIGATSASLAHRPLTSVGYTYKLSKRKISVGQRFENLIYAHHASLREVGIPLLWH